MITLITGRPGHGKSLYTINEMVKEKEKGRNIIAINFNGLELDVEERDDLEEWQNYPQGSLIVVDEMQTYAKQRVKGASAEWITAFSTHRHLGLDFIFVTQHPSLLDVWVRRLVETHIHLVRSPTKAEMSTVYRSERLIDVSNKMDMESIDIEKSNFIFPKKIYELYHSADEHTVKKRIPKKLIYGLVGTVVVFGLIGYGIITIKNLLTVDKQEQVEEGEQQKEERVSDIYNDDYEPSTRIKKVSYEEPETYIYKENMPWTSPLYTEILEVKTVPQVVGCAAISNICNCYTQQGTAFVTTMLYCKESIKNMTFNFQMEPENNTKQNNETNQIRGSRNGR